MALLAAFRSLNPTGGSLTDYLNDSVFANASLDTVNPTPEDVAGFQAFLERYKRGLDVERAAVDNL